MTHSLHRKGTINNLKKDYVIIAMLAAGVNDKTVYEDAKQRQLRIGEIMKNNNPTNLLNEAGWRLSSVVQGCFSDIADVKEIVKTIGITKVIKDLDAKLIDKQGNYELLNLNLRDGCYRPYLKMLNPSIGVWHIEGVHPDCETVEQALNWRNGTNEKPIVLT